jgi:hypothetical protein
MSRNPPLKKVKKASFDKDSHIEQLIKERSELNKSLTKLLGKIKKHPKE